jgi:hypothetical protein
MLYLVLKGDAHTIKNDDKTWGTPSTTFAMTGPNRNQKSPRFRVSNFRLADLAKAACRKEIDNGFL